MEAARGEGKTLRLHEKSKNKKALSYTFGSNGGGDEKGGLEVGGCR